jgi:hypothetical protein
MNTRYALLAACWLLAPALAHAQFVNCPAPSNLTVTQLRLPLRRFPTQAVMIEGLPSGITLIQEVPSYHLSE